MSVLDGVPVVGGAETVARWGRAVFGAISNTIWRRHGSQIDIPV